MHITDCLMSLSCRVVLETLAGISSLCERDINSSVCSYHLFLSHFWFPRESLLLTDQFCLSPLSTDSQRSHLSSFTMKLKDKFHSPKIKRIPSKKGKQQQHEPPAKCTEKPVNKVHVQSYARNYMCVLWEIHLFPTYSLCLFAYL